MTLWALLACCTFWTQTSPSLPVGTEDPDAAETRPSASAPEFPPGPRHLAGVIPASITRPMKPAGDPRLAALLRSYQEPAGEVAWTMDRLTSLSVYEVYDLRFPSPVVTSAPENNTVCCEYYRRRGDQPRPAVVVLHISDGRFRESRLICSFLAMRGYDAVMLKMAYYGPRRPRDPARFRSFTQDLDSLREAVQQSAMDARRVARWLEAQPHVRRDRISILGTSLGGFVGSLASGVDGGFHRTIVILAGGRLEKVLGSPSRESRTVREAIAARGLKTDELVELLEPIEPCTFAARIDPRSVMMVNTRDDPVVPPASARALAETIGGVQILWYDGDHYALIWKLFEVLQRVGEYLDKSGKP